MHEHYRLVVHELEAKLHERVEYVQVRLAGYVCPLTGNRAETDSIGTGSSPASPHALGKNRVGSQS